MSETHTSAADPGAKPGGENAQPLNEDAALDPAEPETQPDATPEGPATPKITASAVTIR